MRIRKAKKQDSRKIFDAHMLSIKEVCSKDYTAEQINGWGGRTYDPEHWPRIIEKSHNWVIADGDNIYGISSLMLPEGDETAHIMALYIVPAALGKGFGKQFIKLALETARSNGYKKVFADSTKTAKKFYISQGFKQSGPENNCMINGQDIEGFPLTYTL